MRRGEEVAGEAGGREPTDGLLLTAGSSHGYREQQEEEDGGTTVMRDAMRTKGSRRCVGANGHEVLVCWGKDRIFQCPTAKNTFEECLAPNFAKNN